MSKTKVAVVGLGHIAQVVHLPILSKMNNVEITAVAELDSRKLAAVSEKFNISGRFKNHADMLKNAEIDAVIIATPTNHHHQVAVDCLNLGKHILVEKPVALNAIEAKRIEDAAQKNNCRAMVGMNLRFHPDAMLLKSLINSGELGDIFYVKCGWLKRQSSDQKWFIEKREAGGGVLIDLGILMLDLAYWFMNYPVTKTISVQKYNHMHHEVEDSAVGLIRCGEDKVINFDVSWSIDSERDTFGMSVFGSKGMAKLNPLRVYKMMESSHLDYTPASTIAKHTFKKSYENELKHFVGAVRTSAPVISSVSESVTRMELLWNIYKSAESNSEIKL